MSEKSFKIIDGDISDGYHTFGELYRHRNLLFIAWMVSDGRPGDVYFVREHFEGWDLICCTIQKMWGNHVESRQISYHVPMEYRPFYLGKIKERLRAEHSFDGHTPNDVLQRIADLIND